MNISPDRKIPSIQRACSKCKFGLQHVSSSQRCDQPWRYKSWCDMSWLEHRQTEKSSSSHQSMTECSHVCTKVAVWRQRIAFEKYGFCYAETSKTKLWMSTISWRKTTRRHERGWCDHNTIISNGIHAQSPSYYKFYIYSKFKACSNIIMFAIHIISWHNPAGLKAVTWL